MKAALIDIRGNWAHFRKSETNNNPLTHDLITKTALVGLIGAVLGKERTEMRGLFPQLCDDLLYGVRVNSTIQKQSWGFTLRSASNLFDKSPKSMEFLRNPDFTVLLALKNEASASLFDGFLDYVKNGKACFPPVLGLHNCPADLFFKEAGEVHGPIEKTATTQSFISTKHKPGLPFPRLHFDQIPTFQTDDFWNLPERKIPIVFPSNRGNVEATGIFYEFSNGESWYLI